MNQSTKHQYPNFPNLEDFFLNQAREGIRLKYADIFFGKYFIYILTPQCILYPCVIYNSMIGQKDYENRSMPKVHFCNCKDLWAIYDKDSMRYKAKIPQNNLFDFQVGIGKNSSNKLFYNTPLSMCETCIEVFETIFLKFNLSPKLEIWNLLFATSKISKLEKVALEDSINLDVSFSHMNVHIGDKNFYLTRTLNDFNWQH